MRGEQSPNGLLYAREHLSCKNYMTDISTGFKYIKFDKEKCIEEEYTHKNYLLFFLKGDFSVYFNLFFINIISFLLNVFLQNWLQYSVKFFFN